MLALASSARQWFLETALHYLGTPYIWGGDDPSGFDCSGLVIECLKSVGILREHQDMTADQLLQKFAEHEVTAPTTGALLFRLNEDGKATHVVICLDASFQIGANSGTSVDTSVAQAWSDNAFVKIRPINFNATQHRVVQLF